MPRFVKYISVMLAAIASGTWGYLRYCSECRSAAPESMAESSPAQFQKDRAFAFSAETGCPRTPVPGIASDPAYSPDLGVLAYFR